MSKDFVLLLFIALLVASPLAYYFMHGWLQNYDYRTTIPWRIFTAAVIGCLLVTLLTVSFQVVKAAMASPIKNLRQA